MNCGVTSSPSPNHSGIKPSMPRPANVTWRMRDAGSSWMFRRIGTIAAQCTRRPALRRATERPVPRPNRRCGGAKSCEARRRADPVEVFQREGYVILERALDRAACDELIGALAPFEAGRPMGRNSFEGLRSHRVYSLSGKGEPFLRLAEQPDVIALADRILLPNYLLSTEQSIRLYPGEAAQSWHTDEAFYLTPRPRERTLAITVIWAIEDFPADNGATDVIPGSHRWGDDHPDTRGAASVAAVRSEEHTSELQSLAYLVCSLLLERKKKIKHDNQRTPPTTTDTKHTGDIHSP